MDVFPIAKIEQNIPLFELEPDPQYPVFHPAETALQLGSLAIEFSRVERVPRYDEESRESDVEHSFMLALVASELARSLYPGQLDVGLVSQYAVVHDLIEIMTGDKATFHYSAEDMAQKEIDEHAALNALLERLPPHTRQLLADYELQLDPEARFVKAVDKLLPVVVDILGPGQKVMNEDYDVHTTDQLIASHQKLHGRIAEKFKEFPEVVSAHGLLCELFELEF